MISLHLPKNSKHTRAKLSAYKRHWKGVRTIRDEFYKQYIHEGLKISEVVNESQISYPTVKRFFQNGNEKGYSYFHGPAVTTIFGIADALGLDVIVKKKNGKG